MGSPWILYKILNPSLLNHNNLLPWPASRTCNTLGGASKDRLLAQVDKHVVVESEYATDKTALVARNDPGGFFSHSTLSVSDFSFFASTIG